MSSNERGLHVSYGYRYGRLAYVVFVETPFGQTMEQAVTTGHAGRESMEDPGVRLEAPKGEAIDLPNYTQLYEIVGDEVHTSDRRVTKEQFEAFLESEPKRYTIKALLDFVGKGAITRDE